MLNTRDEQHTLSQPTRRRANTANGKEGLKHASTLRYIQNTGQGQRGEDMLRPRSKAMRAEMQQHTESIYVPFGLVNSKKKKTTYRECS